MSRRHVHFHKARQTALLHVHKKWLVRSAIVSALDDADFDNDTDKARFTTDLAIMKTDDNIECFDRFAGVLLSNL